MSFCNFLIEKMDRELGDEPSVTFVTDMSGLSMSNFDMQLCMHFLDIALHHYPGVAGTVWLYEASW